ncbi:hypothetical protein LIER_13711 [Lithospermum erythrorhizon]|uniref:Gag-protease polyprotein n=1 Tax=Lithospermum erythrorhizon TaxID=34254 RepID=A0AAV3PWD9_LITER
MEDDESIALYNNKVKDIAHKVTAIEEAQDLTTMRVDELMDNLTTFEMSLDDGEPSKKKGIALKATSEDVDDDDLVESMNLLAKNFKSLKRECEGFGHIQVECPNYIKKQSKNYYTILIDDNSKEEDDQEEKVSNFVTFAAQTEPPIDDNLHDNSEDEDEMTEEGLLKDYKLLYTKWIELTMIYTKVEIEKGKLKKDNDKLTKIVLDHDEEINNLIAQLTALNKGLKMMN